jgi:hypothetical protein
VGQSISTTHGSLSLARCCFEICKEVQSLETGFPVALQKVQGRYREGTGKVQGRYRKEVQSLETGFPVALQKKVPAVISNPRRDTKSTAISTYASQI